MSQSVQETQNEIWKDVPNYNGKYQVSNFGRVKRICKNGKQIILKPSKLANGYYRVCLYMNGKDQWNLHRLVATTWIRSVGENEDVHHRNQLKCCNCVSNLQIVDSYSHNSFHGRKRKHSEQTKKLLSEISKSRIHKRDVNTGRFI